MERLIIQDLGQWLARGDVALWLGPDWDASALEQHHRVLGQQLWLGVWSEARDASMARWMAAECRSSARLIIEVPDQVEDALGEHYSIAEVCPYFYLRGRGTTDSVRESVRQRMAWGNKINQLRRLRQAVLIVTGYRSAPALALALKDIEEVAPDLRAVVLTDASAEFASELEQSLAPGLVALHIKIRVTPLGIGQLLREAVARRPTPVVGPTLRVGNASVPLAPFVSREFPIDGDFVLLTEADICPPRENEDLREAFTDLISGRRLPWRAFAHGLAWSGGRDHIRKIGEWVSRIGRGDVDVIAVDIAAQAGAGLTTLLRQLAFDAALRGCPSLLFRGNGHLHYDRLRSFLTDLYQHESIDSDSQRMPAVLVFDAQDTAADAMGLLNELAVRLARDGRRAIVLRGVPVKEPTHASLSREERDRRPRRSPRVDLIATPLLQGDLNSQQQEDLAAWVSRCYKRISEDLPPAAVGTIRRWNHERINVPLLVCLYFILRDQFSEASDLGGLLVTRARAHITEPPTAAISTDQDRKLSREELLTALRPFGQCSKTSAAPSATEIGAVLLTLSAAGTLNIRFPRALLSDVTRLPSDRVLPVLRALDEADLLDAMGLGMQEGDRLAPGAFYDVSDTVALRHPAYGRLILEWLASDRGADDFKALGGQSDNPATHIVGIVRERPVATQTARLSDYPIELFEPIMRQLRPHRQHVDFADAFAAAYLRFQKNKDRLGSPGLAAWQQKNLELLIDAFGWLDEQVVRESASLLHSRAITTYKSCRENMPIDQQRLRYRRAEADLELALTLAREQGGEHPGNVITSLGLLYLGWAEHERLAGHLHQWRTLDARVEETLREAREERTDNPFAAYGLARYLVERVRRTFKPLGSEPNEPGQSADPGRDLAEALELLAGETAPNFEEEWRELQRKAVEMLSGPEMDAVIRGLKGDRKDIGYSLDALRILGGEIPEVPTQEAQELADIRRAASVMSEAQQAGVPTEALGDLLRYALFSADADRLTNPRYMERYERITRLEGTRYLEQPIWLFDYAMLSFQVGKYEEAADAFAKLRRGKRFFEVPRERSTKLTEGPESLKPRAVFVRIVSGDDGSGKGWCRTDYPIVLRDPMPFSVRSFASRGKSTRVGTSTKAHIAIHPAGPRAEPDQR